MAERLLLPSRIDLTAVTKLHGDLRPHAGQDLTLDLSEVTYLGALGLQLIIATARQAKKAGKSIILHNINDRVIAQMCLLGTCPETIMEGQQ